MEKRGGELTIVRQTLNEVRSHTVHTLSCLIQITMILKHIAVTCLHPVPDALPEASLQLLLTW